VYPERRTGHAPTTGPLHSEATGAVTPNSQTIDTWYLDGSDLVVAQTGDVATSNDSPIGTVHYVERYSIHLTSLTPLS